MKKINYNWIKFCMLSLLSNNLIAKTNNLQSECLKADLKVKNILFVTDRNGCINEVFTLSENVNEKSKIINLESIEVEEFNEAASYGSYNTDVFK